MGMTTRPSLLPGAVQRFQQLVRSSRRGEPPPASAVEPSPTRGYAALRSARPEGSLWIHLLGDQEKASSKLSSAPRLFPSSSPSSRNTGVGSTDNRGCPGLTKPDFDHGTEDARRLGGPAWPSYAWTRYPELDSSVMRKNLFLLQQD
jgi:hypothetical protein